LPIKIKIFLWFLKKDVILTKDKYCFCSNFETIQHLFFSVIMLNFFGVRCIWCLVGMKMVRIFSGRIRDRIRLEGFRSVRIWVRILNIWYRIRIRILKSHIYDIDIQSYPIRHGWHYAYSNPNPTRNIKTNIILVISIRIWSVFIHSVWHYPTPYCRKPFWELV
jgi:hypothetical protein